MRDSRAMRRRKPVRQLCADVEELPNGNGTPLDQGAQRFAQTSALMPLAHLLAQRREGLVVAEKPGFRDHDRFDEFGQLGAGGEQDIEPVSGIPMPALTAIEYDESPGTLALGADLYAKRCAMCHGGSASSGGAIADLRYSSEAPFAILANIVRGGAYASLGMPDLGNVVSESDVDAIRNYLLSLRYELLDD